VGSKGFGRRGKKPLTEDNLNDDLDNYWKKEGEVCK
jgi:hypothetical protein